MLLQKLNQQRSCTVKIKMIYIYKTGHIQVWNGDELLYDGPSYQMAVAHTIPF